MVTVATLYIYTFLQVLMLVFFGLKCAKLSTLCILQIFATTDVVALMISTQEVSIDSIFFFFLYKNVRVS